MTHRFTCPECGEPSSYETRTELHNGVREVYCCWNDEGFILPYCNVAQWTTTIDTMGISKEVDMTKVEAVE